MDTGISRKVDGLGRIVLPAEIRRTFGIKDGDHLDIAVEDDRIILSVTDDRCVFCRSTVDIKLFRERMVCTSCRRELAGGKPTDPAEWDPFAQT
ncbi:MAG: AbrB/MazE/SpoVT family DNA-binding domain-containing protein [Actinomycetota bacterium]